ncbi:MAG: signal peptidase II [Rubellimicrobium sp.]|nr:signal peptidase II [Rubellimicrobium sp.]
MRLTFIVALAAFLLDQASKWIVVRWLDLATRQEIAVLPPWLNFRMAWNRGVNFGILSSFDARWLLIAFALAISAAVLVWVARDHGARPPMRVSAGLLVGGALGNVVDRLIYGAVADFLNTGLPGWGNPFSFNLADVWVFAGAIGLVLFGGGKAKGA